MMFNSTFQNQDFGTIYIYIYDYWLLITVVYSSLIAKPHYVDCQTMTAFSNRLRLCDRLAAYARSVAHFPTAVKEFFYGT